MMEMRKKANSLSSSEENWMRKNKMERKLLADRLNMIAREHKYNHYLIKENAKDVESYLKVIRQSTGSAFNEDSFNSKFTDDSDSKSSKNSEYRNTIRPVQSAHSSMPKPEENSAFKSKSSDVITIRTNDQVIKSESELSKMSSSASSIERFVDKHNRVVYKRNKNDAMKPILARNKTFVNPHKDRIVSDYVSYKEKDLVEWNKYLYRKRNLLGDVDLTNFVFSNEDIYETYLRICEIRDSLPLIPAEEIKQHRNKDPVFSKRYKQFEAAQVTNRAPIFDMKDCTIPRFTAKYTLQKIKLEIIKQNERNRTAKNRHKQELEMLTEKTKTFIERINI